MADDVHKLLSHFPVINLKIVERKWQKKKSGEICLEKQQGKKNFLKVAITKDLIIGKTVITEYQNSSCTKRY